jgi:cell division protein FtsB
LPARGNSENIVAMKRLANSPAAFSCLVIVTAALLAASWPCVGVAQETLPDEAAASSTSVTESIAQQRFISDKLVLNVYAEADQGSARVATLQSGDAVEELERAGNLIRVRLEDGREGWVGANYLVNDAPAIVRLRELQRQQPTAAPRVDKASLDEIARLRKDNEALRGQVNDLQTRIAAAAAARAESNKVIEPPPSHPPIESVSLAGAMPAASILGWLVALMLVGAASYASGYQTLARRLRRKFGALKIY